MQSHVDRNATARRSYIIEKFVEAELVKLKPLFANYNVMLFRSLNSKQTVLNNKNVYEDFYVAMKYITEFPA